jgi:S1 RNA binding domain
MAVKPSNLKPAFIGASGNWQSELWHGKHRRFACSSRPFSALPPPSLPKSHGALLCCTSSSPELQHARGATQAPVPPDVNSVNSAPKQHAACILLETITPGQTMVGTVAQVTSEKNSLWLDVNVVRRGRAGRFHLVRARLPFDRRIVTGVNGTSKSIRVAPQEKVGSRISVRVKTANVASGRLEVERTVKISHRAVGVKRNQHKKGTVRAKRARPPVRLVDDGRLLETLCIGDRLLGSIEKVGSYGVLVDCGVARSAKGGRLQLTYGLLQRKRFPPTWASDADMVFRADMTRRLCIGDEIVVYVQAAHPANGFLWLSATPLDMEALAKEKAMWKTKVRRIQRRRNGPEDLVVNEERVGLVAQVVRYGVFVDIGIKKDGLLHFSQMGRELGRDWRDKLTVGSSIVVKISSVKDERVELAFIGFKGDVEDAIEDAQVTTTGPMARPSFASVTRRSTSSAAHMGGRNALAQPKDFIGASVSSDGDDTGDDGEEAYDDDKAEGEDIDDKFSDSYFEDKYDV